MTGNTKKKETMRKEHSGEIMDKSAEDIRWLETIALFVHDLEAPIASMKYLTGLLERGRYQPSSPDHNHLVHSSRIALKRAESIMYDILEVARAGRTGIPVSVQELLPGPAVKEAVELALAAATERKIKLIWNETADLPKVIADPSLLGRILDNLIFNALRHSPERGEIQVYSETDQTMVRISIKDSGPGLQGADSQTLFSKYGQVNLRAKGKHRGVGLGLYFCRLAAEGMGGKMEAADHADGGAVLTVCLKKAKE